MAEKNKRDKKKTILNKKKSITAKKKKTKLNKKIKVTVKKKPTTLNKKIKSTAKRKTIKLNKRSPKIVKKKTMKMNKKSPDTIKAKPMNLNLNKTLPNAVETKKIEITNIERHKQFLLKREKKKLFLNGKEISREQLHISVRNAVIKRRKFKSTVIGVTGTCGKTTTCKFIHDILKEFVTIDATTNNRNNIVGISYSINDLFDLKNKYWLFEMGVGSPGQMNCALKIVRPRIRVITNIGVAHTSQFENGEKGYVNEKLSFIREMPQGTTLIINNEDERLSKFEYQKDINLIRCGTKPTDDVQLVSYFGNDKESIVGIKYKNEIINFKMNGIGQHNAINLCLAMGCALSVVPFTKIKDKINNMNINMHQNRGNIIEKKNIVFYNHTYNCVPQSVLANLEGFKCINCKNKLIVLGDMTGLQNIRAPHSNVIKKCLTITNPNNIIIFSPFGFYKNIIQSNNYNIVHHRNRSAMIKYVVEKINKNRNDLHVFFQGSHDCHMDIILDNVVSMI
jgi:UDP-N-acetylmuramyl pentapeptide synthase